MRSWITLLLAAGLLSAQEAPAPAPTPAPTPQEAPKAQAEPVKVAEEFKIFEQLRPTQRKFHYLLWRAALAGHELGYYQSHPKAHDVKATLEELLSVKAQIPEKSAAAIPAVEAYLTKIYAAHGLYEGGAKFKLDTTWKDLQKAAAAASKAGVKGLEGRLAKLKGLMLDAKVDATAPSWAEPEAPKSKKAKKPKAPKAPEGFGAQKAIMASWLKKATGYVENVRAEVDVKGEKKMRSVANPEIAKPINDLITALEGEDLALLQNAGLAQLDLRRYQGVQGFEQGRLGQGLLAAAPKLAAGTAPEGAAGEWKLFPALEPVMGESKFSKDDTKRATLGDAKLGAASADLNAQMLLVAKLGRSRELEVK